MKESQDTAIQKSMFHEMKDKSIFEQAKKYAYEYADQSLNRNVFPTKEAINNLVVFDEKLPEEPGDPSLIIEQLHKYGSPATVSQIGGRYFGFVNGGVIPVSLAAKWLADFWDQNTGLYVISPISSKLESVVEKWFQQLFNLPETTVTGFVSGSSMAILCGLAAARFRVYQRLGWDINSKGLINAPPIRIVAGKQAHSTVVKALSLLGMGKDRVEWIETDEQGRIIPEKIPVLNDTTILILQAGNVSTGSFDAFDKICEKAVKANAWVHIDGAFGLWAAGSTKLKYLTKGIEKASSWSVDAHKTLNTPYDCGIVLCNDKEALISALQATGSYIIYSEKRDGMLYTPEMSRRARVVEIWSALKYLGIQGVNDLVEGLHNKAVYFAEELRNEGFEVLNDIVFNQVLFKCENDNITQKTMELVQESGICWCGGTQWKGKKAIRISICSWATTFEDAVLSVKAFRKAYNHAIDR